MEGAPRVAFDIGGTFTDIVLVTAEGRLLTYKILSIPDKIGQDVGRCIGDALNQSGHKQLASLVHGTTIGSNALLEGKGALTGLITTRGFRDELEMRRLSRPHVNESSWAHTTLLVPQWSVKEVIQRLFDKIKPFTPRDLDE